MILGRNSISKNLVFAFLLAISFNTNATGGGSYDSGKSSGGGGEVCTPNNPHGDKGGGGGSYSGGNQGHNYQGGESGKPQGGGGYSGGDHGDKGYHGSDGGKSQGGSYSGGDHGGKGYHGGGYQNPGNSGSGGTHHHEKGGGGYSGGHQPKGGGSTPPPSGGGSHQPPSNGGGQPNGNQPSGNKPNGGTNQPKNGGGDGGGKKNDGGGKKAANDPNSGQNNNNNNKNNPQPKQEAHDQLAVRWAPVFHIDFGNSTKIINLTSQVNAPSQAKVISEADRNDKSLPQALVYKNYRDGFMVVDYHDLAAGVGSAAEFYFNNATGANALLWAMVGILPDYEQQMESVRYADSLEHAKALPRLNKAPSQVSDLSVLNPGDSVTYTSRGGILAFAGAGFSIGGVTASMVAKGTWKVYVMRTSERSALVKISKGNLTSISVSGGTAPISAGAAQYKTVENGWVFNINTGTDTGAKVFSDVMKGNIEVAQDVARVDSRTVTQLDQTQIKEVGSRSTFFFGIPVLFNTNSSEGKTYAIHKNGLNVPGGTGEVHYGVYTSEWVTKFGPHRRRGEQTTFYGAAYTVKPTAYTTAAKGHFGHLFFNYYNDQATDYRLRNGIQSLIRHTGMQKILSVQVPNVSELNYAGIQFDLEIPQAQTELMISRAQMLGNPQQWVGEVLAAAEAYFNGPDYLKLCDDHGYDKTRCENEITTGNLTSFLGIKQGIPKMYEALLVMGKTKDTDPAAYAKAYGDFGAAVLDNPFNFRFALALAGKGVVFSYRVEGQDLSRYMIQGMTTDVPNEFVVAEVPATIQNSSKTQDYPYIMKANATGLIITGTRHMLDVPIMPQRNF